MWVYSNSQSLRITEYHFIAITLRSTQSSSDKTCYGPFYGSNRTKLSTYAKLNCLKLNCVVGRVFANSPGDWRSILGRVIPETLKMVLDTPLLKTQHYKVRFKGKVEQSRERSSPPQHFGVVAIEKGASGYPSTTVTNNLYV